MQNSQVLRKFFLSTFPLSSLRKKNFFVYMRTYAESGDTREVSLAALSVHATPPGGDSGDTYLRELFKKIYSKVLIAREKLRNSRGYREKKGTGKIFCKMSDVHVSCGDSGDTYLRYWF